MPSSNPLTNLSHLRPGDTVVYASPQTSAPFRAVVKSAGRRWVELNNGARFDTKTGREDSQYGAPASLFATEADYGAWRKNSAEKQQLRRQISGLINNLTLDQLRAIAVICDLS